MLFKAGGVTVHTPNTTGTVILQYSSVETIEVLEMGHDYPNDVCVHWGDIICGFERFGHQGQE